MVLNRIIIPWNDILGIKVRFDKTKKIKRRLQSMTILPTSKYNFYLFIPNKK